MIETLALTKSYGDLRAVNNLTLSVNRGDLFGLAGPDGSGKTTTMHILATLVKPTSGEAYVCGYSVSRHRKQIRRLIGYVPDLRDPSLLCGMHDDMTVTDYLESFANTFRIKGPSRRRVCDEMLDFVHLSHQRDALLTSLPRGMIQRLSLARALLHDPQVLLLDDFFDGLELSEQTELQTLLKQVQELGKTIMICSHILPELASLCNRIGIIERGELLVCGNTTDLIRG